MGLLLEMNGLNTAIITQIDKTATDNLPPLEEGSMLFILCIH